ncbi:MAG: DUF5119 domain-containing protein, partial [Rikenellaceae bacterium]
KALMSVDDDPDEDLYSASIWLFPTESSTYQGAPLEYKLSDPEHEYIEIPIGEYNVLVFNKTVSDYTANVGFRGTDSYETFEYYVNSSTKATLFNSKGSDQESASEPDMLAAWSFDEGETLKVTFNEIGYYEKVAELRSRTKGNDDVSTKVTADDFSELSDELKQLLYITPERVVHNVTLHEEVENLHSASFAQANLNGLSSSVKLSSKSYSSATSSHVVTFTNKYYTDSDNEDGYMTGSINVIGPLEEESDYSVEVIFTLYEECDGSLTYPTPPADGFLFDVSDQVNEAIIDLDKSFTIYLDQVALPYIMNKGDSGFNVTVTDWGDPTVVPL